MPVKTRRFLTSELCTRNTFLFIILFSICVFSDIADASTENQALASSAVYGPPLALSLLPRLQLDTGPWQAAPRAWRGRGICATLHDLARFGELMRISRHSPRKLVGSEDFVNWSHEANIKARGS